MAGDLFHSTSANQTATNQQIGLSTRDVGGSVTTGGAGATTASSGIAISGSGGSTINVQSLDAAALNVAAGLAHDAVVANTAVNQQATAAYQKALDVVAENQQATQQIGTGQTAQGTSVLGQIGINPSTIIWGAIVIVGLVLTVGYFKKRR